ncbi:MAG TPA: TlpA disulfide reductase family protein [Candidatus Methanoperedens sp.]|nr:TlpA disulfide reductase family protein [Candidatus Methanoperedens sp.]
MRFLSRSMALALPVVVPLLVSSGAFAQEKNMTPLSGGVPMIEGIKPLEAGAAAPDFAIKDTEGKVFNFREEKGKAPALLVFWSIFCEPCRVEMPIIQRLHEKYPDALTVLAIALDGDPLKNSIVGFVKQEGYTFRVLIDELDEKEMFKVADPYGVGGTPTVCLVDRAGKVALSKVGKFKEEDLEKAIQSVLKK